MRFLANALHQEEKEKGKEKDQAEGSRNQQPRLELLQGSYMSSPGELHSLEGNGMHCQ